MTTTTFDLPRRSSGLPFAGFGTLLVLILALVGGCRSFTLVNTGHVGVLTRFGKVTGSVLPEGLHAKSPIDSATEMSVRSQELKEHAEVPSFEGLIITLEASVIYRLDAASAADVYQKLGYRYQDVILQPTFRSAMRSVTASHNAQDLYSSAREKIATEMSDLLTRDLKGRGIIIETVLLRDLGLPLTLKQSIEQKQQADQDAQRMKFVLQREDLEAQRKRVEAAGIADFQRIVSTGISEQLLKWKGIEATEALAKSPNSKIVVVGSGPSGLPVILGSDR